ncbi:MAG: hypothetical protein BGO69_05710 [Bacteroidetes bacterium 46-16]|nr:MAG: hypothetical protein BGO69_05710 [Bacteroidetes bacterium 46-16]
MPDIRKAKTEDSITIVQLAREIWEPTYDPILPKGQAKYMLDIIFEPGKIEEQIAKGEQQYLLCYDEGKAIGFAAYAPRPEMPEVYKLHKLYCLPAVQGRGYGKMLIKAVEQEVLNAGKNILELNVNRDNKAKLFYEGMGYEVAYDEDIPFGPYWMNDHVMRKELQNEQTYM